MGESNFERQSDIEPIDGENASHEDEQNVDETQIETNSSVLEKREIISFKNFDITFDEKTKDILGEENIASNLKQIKEQIDTILGQEQDLGSEKINVNLFSNRDEYEEFLKNKFPDKSEIYIRDNAIFDQNPKTLEKTIVNYTPIKELSEQDKQRVKEHGMSIEEAEKIIAETARANVLSGVAHEMTHLHPPFGGVGNIASPTKWEQEMVCVFVGEKIRTQTGNEKFRQTIFEKAQDELRQQEELNLENDGKNWEEVKKYEGFFYPYLEKQYGLEKLQILWHVLFKEPKESLSEALENIYEKNTEDIEREFRSKMLTSSRHEEVEEI